MCPVLHCRLAGLDIPIVSFGLFTVLAAFVNVLLAFVSLRHAGLSPWRILLLITLMTAGFLMGARLWNYAVNPGAYDKGFTLFTLKLANFSLYGGIAGAFIAFLLLTRQDRKRRWPLLDALVLPAAVSFALVRVGCFLNGCCGGKLTQSWLGMRFPQSTGGAVISTIPLLGKINLPAYPTQLFELGFALLGLVPVLWLYFRRKVPSGIPFLVYGIWFTAMRWVILPLRELPYPEYIVTIVYPLIYSFLIAAGCVLVAVRLWKYNR